MTLTYISVLKIYMHMFKYISNNQTIHYQAQLSLYHDISSITTTFMFSKGPSDYAILQF